MRHLNHIIEKARSRGRVMGLASQKKQSNDRLQAALESGPIRTLENYLVHEFISINPRTGKITYLELFHDIGNGNDRFNLYIDGKKHGQQWSRWGLCQWLFKQIDSVRNDWS